MNRLTQLSMHSDTTAPSLTTLFYLLARNPRDIGKIQQELDSVDAHDIRAVAALSHLNGAVNEAMRLLPAVLTFVTRVSPPEGMEVEGTFIPGNIKIAAPRYSIGRCKFRSIPSSLGCFISFALLTPKSESSGIGLGRSSCILPRTLVQPARNDQGQTCIRTIWDW